MTPDSGDSRLSTGLRSPHFTGTPPDLNQNLPLRCPRCESTNTKFCYYNNYNLSQPRHYCKTCRRYWTQGGALRNVPVGGGTRKHVKVKRSRSTTITTATSSSSSSDHHHQDLTVSAQPISSRPLPTALPMMIRSDVVNLNVNLNGGANGLGSFLSAQGLTFNGYGLGLGYDYDEFGPVWPLGLPDVTTGATNTGGGDLGVGMSNGNTWQFGIGGETVYGETECYPWPELAISTPRTGVKGV